MLLLQVSIYIYISIFCLIVFFLALSLQTNAMTYRLVGLVFHGLIVV